MKYTVVSTPIADHQLAEIWLQAPNRQEVADALDKIESQLRQNADQQGRLHPNGWRVLSHPPLVVTFKVSNDDRKVTIISVHLLP
jgi:hypothetical protein